MAGILSDGRGETALKLSEVQPGYVVRNVNNGAHYHFERSEKGRARIYPLELFPTGLLIPKPAPTLVDLDIDVALIGPWTDGIVVEGKPSHSRRTYENELVQRKVDLVELELVYEQLPQSGVGKQSRGSWANKVKNCRSRIEALERGLGFVHVGRMLKAQMDVPIASFAPEQLVQLPSGRPARIVDFVKLGDTTYANVVTALQGNAIAVQLTCEALRPWTDARICSV